MYEELKFLTTSIY